MVLKLKTKHGRDNVIEQLCCNNFVPELCHHGSLVLKLKTKHGRDNVIEQLCCNNFVPELCHHGQNMGVIM